jgi:predicted ribonuclease YlaK
MEVHLIADTNLFFECKALEELPWSELGYDPVVILLTKPVLDEIDKHKRGSGRTRKRALEIFQRVRSMLESSAQEVEIQASSPRVVLRRTSPSVAPDPTHKDHLDYAKTDDRLIGIASTLSAQASGLDVKLFTDDTGPASTADGLGVPYLMISENWRRPASETTEERRSKILKRILRLIARRNPRLRSGAANPLMNPTS